MAAPKHRKTGDWRNVVDKVHKSLLDETANKLFEDDYFVFELIKLLYEESLEAHMKMEILTVIEQWGSGVLPTNSIDQAITALLDVFQDLDTSPASVCIGVQLLLTVTTLFIESEELLEAELCTNYVTVLTNLVSKTNNINTRRLRASACQCLVQLESWKPGLLWRSRETFVRLVREEKTDVCQDYMQLLLAVAINTDKLEREEQATLISETRKKTAQIHTAVTEGKDVLSTVSLIMDNLYPLTPAGLLSVACSVVQLVKSHKDIPPNVFKPLILQCFPSMDLCVIFMMLFLQRKFRGELLSDVEEKLLLKRALECVNHTITETYTRLIILEWLLSYIQKEDLVTRFPQVKKLLLPVVFDPFDVHIRKLSLLALCSSSDPEKDVSTDLHYLTQVAVTTGSMRVATALYHILYLHVGSSRCDAVHDYVLRVTKKLFQKFAHLIPLIVDFLRAVKTSQPHSKLHSEILTLLHETVISLPISSLLSSSQNYLQVWILSAQESAILQQKPLRRMLEIVQEAVFSALNSWDLGCLILSICHMMMLHHHTDILYSPMGDLLCFLMNKYGDTDIQDQARFLYSLLTLTSDTKMKEILGATVIDGLRLGENIADFFPGSVVQVVPADINLLGTSPIVWNRECLEIVYNKRGEKMDCSLSQPAKDGLDSYWEQVLTLETSLKCTMKVGVCNESDFDNLLAVSFQASDNDKTQLSPDVCIPYLSKGASTTVCYVLKPKVPEPVLITARAVFGCEKTTYECELLPLKFEWQDFLLPFPWHMFDIPDRYQFFTQHWNNYTHKSQGKSMGVESVKILKCSRQCVADTWRKALIKHGGEHKDADDYMFFLPPRFHLLFHVKARSTDLVVYIASDYWPVLHYLDEYLDNLV